MAVPRGLKRLSEVRALEEKWSQAALEKALSSLHALEAALRAAKERERNGRRQVTASAGSADAADRIAALEEMRAAGRNAAAVEPESSEQIRAELVQMRQMVRGQRDEPAPVILERKARKLRIDLPDGAVVMPCGLCERYLTEHAPSSHDEASVRVHSEISQKMARVRGGLSLGQDRPAQHLRYDLRGDLQRGDDHEAAAQAIAEWTTVGSGCENHLCA